MIHFRLRRRRSDPERKRRKQEALIMEAFGRPPARPQPFHSSQLPPDCISYTSVFVEPCWAHLVTPEESTDRSVLKSDTGAATPAANEVSSVTASTDAQTRYTCGLACVTAYRAPSAALTLMQNSAASISAQGAALGQRASTGATDKRPCCRY